MRSQNISIIRMNLLSSDSTAPIYFHLSQLCLLFAAVHCSVLSFEALKVVLQEKYEVGLPIQRRCP